MVDPKKSSRLAFFRCGKFTVDGLRFTAAKVGGQMSGRVRPTRSGEVVEAINMKSSQ